MASIDEFLAGSAQPPPSYPSTIPEESVSPITLAARRHNSFRHSSRKVPKTNAALSCYRSLMQPSSGRSRECTNLWNRAWARSAGAPCARRLTVLLHAMAGSVAAVLAIAAPAPAAQWFPAVPMHEPRGGQTATLLPDGEVLVAGGYHIVVENTGHYYESSRSTELFNPTTNTWRPAAPMLAERSLATATLLTNGDVLITGGERYVPGRGEGLSPEVPAETYDPSTNIWMPFPSPELGEVSELAPLPSGWVFALGVSAGALYDPATDTWEPTAAPAHPRHDATLALLQDGNVLAIGGFTVEPRAPHESRIETAQDTVEEYDPLTNTWRELAPMREARSYETATVLADGEVFVDGGEHELSRPILHINGEGYTWYGTMPTIDAGVTSAEQYDPATNRWVGLAPMAQPRAAQTTTLLDDGSLLVTGGDQCGTGGCLDSRPPALCNGDGCAAASAELYEPNPGTWTFTPPVISGQDHTATLLPNGAVLVTGGSAGDEESSLTEPATVFSSAEIYAERYPPDETVGPGSTGARPTGAGVPQTPPRIERISQSHKRWRKRHVGSARGVVGHRRPPVGTTFAVTLNEAAKVSQTFTQVQHGHRVHESAFSFAGHAGTNKVAFSGRIGKARALASGEYTVTIVAVNAAGRSAAKRLSFTITK